MAIPRVQPLLLPVLEMIADGRSVEEIREKVRVRFDITPSETVWRLSNGVPTWHNRIAWAFSHLVTGKLIAQEEEGTYQITLRGADILKENPSELKIRDLR